MIAPRHFEKMADECGLTKPLVKRHILELADSIISGLDTLEINHPVPDRECLRPMSFGRFSGVITVIEVTGYHSFRHFSASEYLSTYLIKFSEQEFLRGLILEVLLQDRVGQLDPA